MHAHATRPRKIALLGVIGLTLLACNLQLDSPEVAQGTSTPYVPSAAASAFPSAEGSATIQVEASSTAPAATSTATAGTPPVVSVSAFGGRLNVRRGPGAEYDIVGAFRDGQTSVATARNADGSWVLMNIPTTSKTLGWITVGTKYTSLSGDVAGLPLVQVDPALPAYVRNCTPHEMLVNPGGTTLLSRSSSPDNQLQLFPGEYNIVDQTTETDVASVTVFEGKTIDIKKDSSGTSYACP